MLAVDGDQCRALKELFYLKQQGEVKGPSLPTFLSYIGLGDCKGG